VWRMSNIVDPATETENIRISPITNISAIRVPGEVLDPPPVDCNEAELYFYFSHYIDHMNNKRGIPSKVSPNTTYRFRCRLKAEHLSNAGELDKFKPGTAVAVDPFLGIVGEADDADDLAVSLDRRPTPLILCIGGPFLYSAKAVHTEPWSRDRKCQGINVGFSADSSGTGLQFTELLFDTGCSKSWLPAPLLDDSLEKGIDALTFGAGGTPHSSSTYYVYIHIDGLVTKIAAIPGDTMLGLDVIKRYRCVIDFSQQHKITLTALPKELNHR